MLNLSNVLENALSESLKEKLNIANVVKKLLDTPAESISFKSFGSNRNYSAFFNKLFLSIDKNNYLKAFRKLNCYSEEFISNDKLALLLENLYSDADTVEKLNISFLSIMQPVDDYTCIYKGHLLILSHLTEEDSEGNTIVTTTFKVYGLHRKYLIRKIAEELEKFNRYRLNILAGSRLNVRLFTVTPSINNNYEVTSTYVPEKHMKHLFLDTDVKNDLISLKDNYDSLKPIFEEKGIARATTILLHGPKGTGKTSIVRWLSSSEMFSAALIINVEPKYICDIPKILKHRELVNLENATKIVVCEEIDVLYELEDADERISKLQQVLSGLTTPNKTIFVFTTNHLDKLDDRVTGRVQLLKEIPNLNKDLASKMIESFGVEPSVFIDENVDEYNPRTLENQIRNYLVNMK